MNYKGYLITAAPNSPTLYKVALAGQGGRIPNTLLGLFTAKDVIMQLVDVYLETQKGNTNGQTTSKRGAKGFVGGSGDGSISDGLPTERDEG